MGRPFSAIASLGLSLVTGLGACVPFVGDDQITVTTYLADSAGLFVGNDVGVLGVPVGSVESIEPIGDRVRVTLTIDSEVAVPADVGAVVTARSVATDRYVELTPVYRDGPTLEDGGEIPQENTRTPIDFDTVLATLSKFSKGITGSEETTDAIRNFLQVGAEAFEGNGKHIRGSIEQLALAVEAVSGQRDNILASLESLDTLTRALAANETTIREFTGSISRASALLADERANLKAALQSLQDSITVVAAFAQTHRSELMRTVNNLSDVIGVILASRTDLEEMIETFPLTLQNLDRAVDDGYAYARLAPAFLTPFGEELQALCQSLGEEICDSFGLSPSLPLSDLLLRSHREVQP